MLINAATLAIQNPEKPKEEAKPAEAPKPPATEIQADSYRAAAVHSGLFLGGIGRSEGRLYGMGGAMLRKSVRRFFTGRLDLGISAGAIYSGRKETSSSPAFHRFELVRGDLAYRLTRRIKVGPVFGGGYSLRVQHQEPDNRELRLGGKFGHVGAAVNVGITKKMALHLEASRVFGGGGGYQVGLGVTRDF